MIPRVSPRPAPRCRPLRLLNDEEWRALRQAYEGTAKLTAIAEDFGTTAGTLSKIAAKRGWALRRWRKEAPEIIDDRIFEIMPPVD